MANNPRRGEPSDLGPTLNWKSAGATGAVSRLVESWIQTGMDLAIGSTWVFARTLGDLRDSYCAPCPRDVEPERPAVQDRRSPPRTDLLGDFTSLCDRTVERAADVCILRSSRPTGARRPGEARR